MEKKESRSYGLVPYLILLVSFFAVLAVVKAGRVGDDAWFRETFEEMDRDLPRYLSERYESWTSRMFIEAITVLFTCHVKLWAFLTALLYSLCVFLTGRMIFAQDRGLIGHLAFVSVFFALPRSLFSGAGWISTTANYLWPVSLMLIVVYDMYVINMKEKITLKDILLTICLSLCAVSSEMVCSIFFIISVFGIVTFIRKGKKLWIQPALSCLICICGFAVILTCPGNMIRRSAEVTSWFPDFDSLDLFTKLEIGFSSTMSHFTAEFSPVFMLLLVLLAICTFLYSEKKIIRLVSLLPLLINLVFLFVRFDNLVIAPKEFDTALPFINYGTMPDITHPVTLLPDTLFIIMAASVVTVLIELYKEEKNKCLMIIMIPVLGFASRMIMSFSPTVWVSGIRTFYMMYLSVIVLSGILIKKVMDKKPALLAVIPFFAAYGALQNIIEYLSY
ncbi:MAG: DUF6056 family protein [Lachnospiraceae bacterium]|nr:DUF6056 family protein [Lachnospiraceae bacterium]